MRRFACVSTFLLAVLVTTACSERGESLPETGATLEGTVTYNGEPIQFALVIITSSNWSSTGRIEDDGKYRATNVPLGEVKVGVNTDAGRGDFMTASMSQSYQGPEAKKGGRTSIKFLEVPKQYHDPETSGLKTTIAKGNNTYNITITK